jgi:hypothetical protein
VPTQSGTWYSLFSTTLEDAIMYSSKDGIIPKSLAEKLSDQDVEDLEMWSNKQHGVLPNQYHYAYEQGDTLIYPEHIKNIRLLDKIVTNKHEADRRKEEAKQQSKQNNPLKGGSQKGGGSFYGHTFKFNQ